MYVFSASFLSVSNASYVFVNMSFFVNIVFVSSLFHVTLFSFYVMSDFAYLLGIYDVVCVESVMETFL